MPLKKQKPHPLSLTAMKKKIGSPQFRADLKLRIEAVGKAGKRALKLSIPPADGNPDSRVYAFDVIVAGDDPGKKLLKSVYAAGANMGVGHAPNGGVTIFTIPVAQLPKGTELTVAVRPITSLGTRGRAITWRQSYA